MSLRVSEHRERLDRPLDGGMAGTRTIDAEDEERALPLKPNRRRFSGGEAEVGAVKPAPGVARMCLTPKRAHVGWPTPPEGVID